MIEPKKAAFKFSKFKVPKFSYDESSNQDVELSLSFNPSGIYYKSEGRFELTVSFIGVEVEADNKKIIEVQGLAQFNFSECIDFSEIPDYFYTNSIPIFFPYLRSFVSTLTMQANTGVIMLGLLNFSSMAKVLVKNTVVVD
jgi:preprotein translocase subunit SecB